MSSQRNKRYKLCLCDDFYVESGFSGNACVNTHRSKLFLGADLVALVAVLIFIHTVENLKIDCTSDSYFTAKYIQTPALCIGPGQLNSPVQSSPVELQGCTMPLSSSSHAVPAVSAVVFPYPAEVYKE